METIFFSSEFFLKEETVTDISEGQFLKEEYILTNENKFYGKWKPFSSIFCYHFFQFSLLSEKNERKWFPLEGETSEQKKTVSTSQKIRFQ